MTILSTDTCIRANQSGLGTSSDGETYTVNGSITTSIASNEAVVSGSATFTSAILGTQTTADINFLVRAEQISSNFDGVGPIWRSSADGQNGYFVAIYSGNLLFAKLVSNGFTQLASVNVSEVQAVFYWIRVSMIGNHLQARVWQDGTSEPSTWNIDTADATYTAAGRYGISFNAFSGSGVQFDHITVTDGISTSTRTITPVTAALKTTNTRTVGATAALKTTNTRSVPDTAALKTTLTRPITPVSAALKTTLTRSVPDTAALKTTNTRTIGATASLVFTRSVPAAAALKATSTRTIPATVSLSGVIPPQNAMVIVRSGNVMIRTSSGNTSVIIK